MCNATRDIMDCMFEVHSEILGDVDDIPQTSDPLWILGKRYNAILDLYQIRQDIVSKLWFTYRKNFKPIGGSEGYTTDKGWGCMLRCGQMVLAQALIHFHLGRDWLWEPDTKDSTYLKILKKFEDKRAAPFSIHQIAAMGETEGKDIGQWFGPNTVAQVLKRLIKYDNGNSMVIHVALDNTVVISDIRDQCSVTATDSITTDWKPLLLIVPLRLGLSEINSIYINGLKKCFHFSQSLGVIGGKPNLALYFIGYVGNEVIYLDPHLTQRSGSVDNKQTDDCKELDATYHCKYASRMNFVDMDPSVAVCFLCSSESDFINLCQNIKDELIHSEKQPLFEVIYERPLEWEPLIQGVATGSGTAEVGQESDKDEFEIL